MSAMTCRPLLSLLLILSVTSASHSQRLIDVTHAAGIDYVHNRATPGNMTGGVAAGDVDGDGWTDLYVTRIDDTDILYLNQRDGTFRDATADWFGDSMRDLPTNGAAWGDIDNDGDLDLYVTSWLGNANLLYLNRNGQFIEAGVERGVAVDPGTVRTAVSAIFGDYDNDGYLDLYTTEWAFLGRNHGRLLRNLGAEAPGHFEDVTEQAGVAVVGNLNTFSPRFSDLDRDGHLDLAVVADFETTEVYWNRGDGTFVAGADQAGIVHDRSAMGFALGDYDNDSDLDLFLGNIDWDGNQLYQNQAADGSPRTFLEVAESAGVQRTGWTWGASFFELDNDGDLDLVATNGWPPSHTVDPMFVFRNSGSEGGYTFDDVSDLVLQPRDTGIGSGLAVFDYDNDGDQDLFVVNGAAMQRPVLYQNEGQPNGNYLQVATVGTLSNANGYGAWITLVPDENDPTWQFVWEVNGGSNFLGQNDSVAHFGLGERAAVDLLRVDWPSGLTQIMHDLPVNQRIVIVEPVPEPTVMPCWVGLAGCGVLCCGRARKSSLAPVAQSMQ